MLLLRLNHSLKVSNEFQPNKEPTIGAAFLTQKCRLEDRILRYEIWDTAGQERFHSLAVGFQLLPFITRSHNCPIVAHVLSQCAGSCSCL